MLYDVEFAIGYDHGGWKVWRSVWVEVDIPQDTDASVRHEHIKEAAGEALRDKVKPTPKEVFAVILNIHEQEQNHTGRL